MTQKLAMSWSGGKDSSLALLALLRSEAYEVVELFTTINAENERVGLHGVPSDLIEAQARSLGIALQFIPLQKDASNESFERAMRTYYQTLVDRKIGLVGFGDIFLEDLKEYRDKMLAEFDLTGIYPLWGKSTRELPRTFLNAGFKSIICSANAGLFEQPVAGKIYDESLLESLPASVDPNGENGEFHSFVFDGPCFNHPVRLRWAERVVHHYEFQTSDGSLQQLDYEFADLRVAED